MKRREIKKKLESIVDFAGVSSFIDTPVKRYSSGMYLRLGFSIAAHLDPDILLLDEVLAVGDAVFQTKLHRENSATEKCTGPRSSLSLTISAQCRVYVIESSCCGKVRYHRSGPPRDVISEYEHMLTNMPVGDDRRAALTDRYSIAGANNSRLIYSIQWAQDDDVRHRRRGAR